MRRVRVVAACVVVASAVSPTSSDLPGSSPTMALAAVTETVDAPLVNGKPGGTFRLAAAEPQAIDPSNTAEDNGHQIASYLFTGLVKVARDGSVSSGVATRWESNPNCTQWTFTLRAGTRFHNGEEVTSVSFKRGWERGAAGKGAYYLGPVDSIDASDPYVLRVTLDRPECEFPLRMVQPVFSPVPSGAGPAENRAYNDQPVGNGPFMMAGPWQHDRGLTLSRYEDYQLGAKANLDSVEVTFGLNPVADSYQGFRAGQVDWTPVPMSSYDEARSAYQHQGKLIVKHGNGTTYLLPVVTTKPLDSVAARKAISLAIDRDTIITGLLHNGDSVATSLVPPHFGTAFQPNVCDACRFDPAEARRLAMSAGLTPGTVLHFRFNDQSGHEQWTAAIKRQLETTLGLRVNYYNLPFSPMGTDERAPGASGISRAGWVADFPSPGDLLEPLLSTSTIGTADPARPVTGDNAGRYSNPQVDGLLDRARTTERQAERIELYRQAERIAIGEDLALIPLWYRQIYRLANTDRFTNYRVDWHQNVDLSLISIR